MPIEDELEVVHEETPTTNDGVSNGTQNADIEDIGDNDD